MDMLDGLQSFYIDFWTMFVGCKFIEFCRLLYQDEDDYRGVKLSAFLCQTPFSTAKTILSTACICEDEPYQE